MESGNAARVKLQNGAAVALLSLEKVKELRKENTPEGQTVAYKSAYIFNSLKHPTEVTQLRAIYGDHFFVISLYQAKTKRLDSLAKKIMQSSSDPASDDKQKNAYETASSLIEKDEHDDLSLGQYGQSVRDTFPHADLFVTQDDQENQISRFIKSLFGARFITPTIDEYGMQLAHTVAFKSADLSRQVGAVILSDRGDLIAAGSNEVPQPCIGNFWEGDECKDYRDFKSGQDENVKQKNDLLEELFDRLKTKGWLSCELSEQDGRKLAQRALYDPEHQILKDTRINRLLEFGRIVHAEMTAITAAARQGRSLLNATLYCTTFPCHICARHIIAAGIKRVVFIEPYPKSLTSDLYKGMVKIDECVTTDKHVLTFDAFIGFAPRQYNNLFSKLRRKDSTGNALSPDYLDGYPRISRPDYLFSYFSREDAALISTKELVSKKNDPRDSH